MQLLNILLVRASRHQTLLCQLPWHLASVSNDDEEHHHHFRVKHDDDGDMVIVRLTVIARDSAKLQNFENSLHAGFPELSAY